jgi:hypothetical protein
MSLGVEVGLESPLKRLHRRIAQLVVDERDERYSNVTNHSKISLRLFLLKSILVSVRRDRGAKA